VITKYTGREGLLALLVGGCSPEEVEAMLAGDLPYPDERTALSDPTNVLMQEVVQDDTGARTRTS
jgi:hypothetical protein